ncbi:single stranded dna binding protein [Echinococcus multilocularis]|uniref:Single stranded dna binding protein n=1 Tax=Echinococcus multilocularis TaxID=6211 RepID=A0A068Y921_ECHMU|nr:single stranded dna binding protein [Echinococcus multilocularis]
MYGKNKMMGVPSEAQSKEKLAMYVHEYLVHIGAQKTANSFLQEGFVNSGYPNGLPHEHCMPGRPMPNAPPFMHRVSQPGPHPGLQGAVTSMPPTLGGGPPEALGGGAMRQRPTLPPMMPGGQPPGPPMHPSMRFHQPPYGPPVGGMMPGPPGHPHIPPRARWMGPGGPQPQQAPPPIPQQQPPCSSVGPPQASGGGGGIAASPGHPGTPGGAPPHVASPNNGNNPNPESQPPPSHYAPQQQTSPASSSNLPNDQQSQPQPIFTNRTEFDGGPAVIMNGGSGRSSGPMMPPPPPEYGLPPNSGGPGLPYPGPDVKMSPMHAVDMMGGPPPNGPGQQSMMMPSEYGGGPPGGGGGTGGPGGGGGGGFVGAPQPQIPPEMMTGGQPPGNGGSSQPPPSTTGPPMMQPQQPHNVVAPGQAPPPPQYMFSSRKNTHSTRSHNAGGTSSRGFDVGNNESGFDGVLRPRIYPACLRPLIVGMERLHIGLLYILFLRFLQHFSCLLASMHMHSHTRTPPSRRFYNFLEPLHLAPDTLLVRCATSVLRSSYPTLAVHPHKSSQYSSYPFPQPVDLTICCFTCFPCACIHDCVGHRSDGRANAFFFSISPPVPHRTDLAHPLNHSPSVYLKFAYLPGCLSESPGVKSLPCGGLKGSVMITLAMPSEQACLPVFCRNAQGCVNFTQILSSCHEGGNVVVVVGGGGGGIYIHTSNRC